MVVEIDRFTAGQRDEVIIVLEFTFLENVDLDEQVFHVFVAQLLESIQNIQRYKFVSDLHAFR